MDIQALPYISLSGFFFGSSFIAARFAVGQFGTINYVFLRLFLASLIFGAVYIFDRHRVWPTDPRLWKHGIVLGFLATVIPMLSFNTALNYLSSGVTAVFRATEPAFIVILAHFVLAGERLTGRKIVGVILALSGVLLLTLRGETGLATLATDPIGYLWATLALLGGSLGTVYARKYAQNLSVFDITTVQMLVGTAVLSLFILQQGGLNIEGIDSLGYMALGYGLFIGTIAGFLLFYYNIRRFGATATAITTYIIPIIATLGGVMILDEKLTGGMLAGMGLIISGIAILNLRVRVA